MRTDEKDREPANGPTVTVLPKKNWALASFIPARAINPVRIQDACFMPPVLSESPYSFDIIKCPNKECKIESLERELRRD